MPVTTSSQQTKLAASSGQTSTPSALSSLLTEAVEQVAQLGGEFNTAGQKLQSLRNRLAEERFHLAVLGQFKRGKSTLLNALLGQTLLPMSVVPLTAGPIVLAHFEAVVNKLEQLQTGVQSFYDLP